MSDTDEKRAAERLDWFCQCAELIAERHGITDQQQHAADIRAILAENDRLRSALQPFADEFERCSIESDRSEATQIVSMFTAFLPTRVFRRAAEVIGKAVEK